MSNLTQWAGGSLNSNSVGYQFAFSNTDLNSLSSNSTVSSSVLSSITFNNTSGLDQFMDISFTGSLAAANTIAAGAGISFFLAPLQGDGITYGDGRLVAGTQTAYNPLVSPLGGFPVQVGSAITNIAGSVVGIVLPPRQFKLVIWNNLGFNLASSNNVCYISTYRQNTNS